MDELDESSVLAEAFYLSYIDIFAIWMSSNSFENLRNVLASFGLVNVLELNVDG
jgi:hypothetical protein